MYAPSIYLGITNPLISFPAVLVTEAERAPRQGTGHVGEPPDQDSQPARMSPSCGSYKLLIHYHSPAILVTQPQHAPRQTTRRSPLPQPARMSLPLSIQNLLIRHRLPQPFQLHKASIFRAGHREIGNLLGLYPLARTSDRMRSLVTRILSLNYLLVPPYQELLPRLAYDRHWVQHERLVPFRTYLSESAREREKRRHRILSTSLIAQALKANKPAGTAGE